MIHLRRYNSNIKLIGIIPYDGFDADWSIDWKKHYKLVCKELDWFHVVSPQYRKDAYQLRNEFMVDHCSCVLAVYSGIPGGTRNTILYAKNKNIPVITVEV